ncbi:oxidoreductase-like protein [Trypanosoma conorhini]|uniref:Oxidoreductase-like protein n=1 Tax=Trypanosoma conorhini TaxID=83891 RepID=A0A3R7LHY6_9TRYP|nr:oxidoreductase-like protein [Trypanosoma conorhini]RNF27612.1 oxidoreductase-like protein [Trypanosoma conorhini]
MTPAVHVGLLGASAIARKVWDAINRAGLLVTVVGSRNPQKAEAFVQECCEYLNLDASSRPRVCSYEELVVSDDVDVVYISIPVMERPVWVVKCAEHDKHVVGEKPPAENAAVLQDWLERLGARQLLYMDGTMFSHGPWVQKLLETLPRCGKVRRMTAALAWCADAERRRSDIRLNPALENLGALGDCGWYCVRVMLHAMNFQMPKAVVGRILEKNEKGAILAFSGELSFDVDGERVTGYLYCALNSAQQAEFTVSGTTGIIEAPNIYVPVTAPAGRASFKFVEARTAARGTELTVTREEHVIAVPDEDGYCQQTRMWRDVDAALSRNREGRLVASAAAMQQWGRMAWMTQCILDKLAESAEVQLRA